MENLNKIIIEKSFEWYEKTIDWKKEDWIEYQKEMFEKQKRTPWTIEKFPKLQNITYDELANFPSTDSWPSVPESYPTVRKMHTTGTVKLKYVEFNKEDLIFNSKIIGATGLRLYDEEDRENGLFIGSDEGAASTGATYILINFFKKYFITFGKDFVEKLSEIKRNGPYTLVFSSQIVIRVLLENLKENIFKDGVVLTNFADILYPSYLKFINEKMKELGLRKYYVYDAYGSTEVPIIAISYEYKSGNLNLIMSPDMAAMVLEKENGERINLFDAKKGDRGEILLTPLRSFMVPNYRQGDVIEVIGINKRTGLPEIKVLGRRLHEVSIVHPTQGVIRGKTGAMIKLSGAPINTYGIDRVLSEITSKYFMLIEKERNGKYLFKLLIDKKVDEDTLIEMFNNDPLTEPISILKKMKAIDFDIIVEDINLLDYLIKNWRGGQPKTPRVVLIDEEESEKM